MAAQSESESARGRPTTAAPVAPVAPAGPVAPVLVARRPPLWRRLLAWALLLLFCLAAPLALLAGWGRWAVSDPDRYAATVRSAAADPGLQAALAGAVADRVDDPPPAGVTAAAPDRFAASAVQADPPAPTATAIPPERAIRRAASPASPTPSPATARATPPAPPPSPPSTRVASTTPPPAAGRPGTPVAATPVAPSADSAGSPALGADEYFRSPEFTGAWDDTNRRAYAALRDGDPSEPLALDLSPVFSGLAAAGGVPAPAAATGPRVDLLDAAAADRLRDALERLDWLSIALPAVAALLLIGTIWAGPGKLRWLRRLGFGLALSMVVLLLTLLLGAQVATGRVGDPLAAEIVRALLDALLWWPVLLAAALVAIGLVVAVLAGLLGWLVAGRRARARA